MTKQELLAWGRQWHYPQLVLPGGLYLRAGEEAYQKADRVILCFASDRIAEWQARYGMTKPVERVDIVDKLLIKRLKEKSHQLV